MIENIILKYLKADNELAQLTGGNIYPDVGQVPALPCVVFSADSPTSPSDNPWDYTQNITFEIYAQTEKVAQNIRNRFYYLLNLYDDFYLIDTATGIIIREAHAVPASVSNHFPNETEQAKEKAVSFDFRFTKCA
jgi:hypothetical protein